MNAYPTRKAWLTARGHRVGGSDVAAILGLSPWSGPWDVWARVVLVAEQPRTEAELATLARGRLLERAVLDLAAERVRPTERTEAGYTGVVGERHWMWASPDGVWTVDGVRVGVEAKTAREASAWGPEQTIGAWTEDAAQVIPEYYATQVYWYLHVTGLPAWYVAVMLPFFDVRIYRVERDERTQRAIVDAVSEWYATHVEGGVEPDPVRSGEAKRMAAMRSVPKTAPELVADADLSAVVAEWRRAKDLETTWTDRRKAEEVRILSACRDERKVRCLDGSTVTIVRARGTAYLKG